ncbi:LptF/LptG family permease [Shimia aestuarii]|uniref:LptF/LptG family permease n=1 Tax=Shimia aestuarii TaxID=254406 RepID=UPI001FB200E9|nr:LptF/LptG family permease [Shimia aestuarii]
MIRVGPVTRILARPTLARLGLLLVLVVAVFLAESFTTLMEEALRYGGGSADVLLLLAYQAPEIVDLALALGVLIALFFALWDARDRGELVVLATSGVGWPNVLGFALILGVLGGILSIGVAGYVIPTARYAERIAMADLRSDHVLREITAPGPRNSRQTINKMTYIATPPTDEAQLRGQLFAFQMHPDQSWRAGQSRDWDVIGPDEDGNYVIKLNTTVAYTSPGFGSETEEPPAVSTVRVRNTGVDFRMEEVLPVAKKAHRDNESPVSLMPGVDPRLGNVLTRGLLVPMAALLAVAAVLASGQSFLRFLTLPAAALLLLLFDVLGRTVVRDLLDVLPFWQLVCGACLAYLGPSLAFVLMRGEAVMLPVRGKT